MKKLYTLTLALATAVSLSASAFRMNLSQPMNGLQPQVKAYDKFEQSLSVSKKNLADMEPSFQSEKLRTLAVPSGSWTSLGEGTWYEGLMTRYTDIPLGKSWKVNIEESQTTPGYYRLQPWNTTESYLYQLIGYLWDETVYIDATNPDKVYIDGYLLPYNMIIFSQLTPENGWTGYAEYGTLKEKVITFPDKSFVFSEDGNDWYFSNRKSDFKIALPGAVVKDYTLTMTAPYCEENNELVINVQAGSDIAKAKYILLPGYYTASDNNNQVVVTYGNDFNLSYNSLIASGLDTGLYSVLMVGLDETGAIVAGTNVSFFMVDDDADNWESYGTATYDEGILSALFEIDSEALTVQVEQHKSLKGYFRLVNPYANHSIFGTHNNTHGDHNHYLYINATDPDKVYVEASPAGFDFQTYGQGMIYSWAGYYIDADYEPEAEDLGTYSNNVITMPDNSLIFCFNNYDNGKFLTSGDGFKVTLSPTSAINGVAAEADDAEAEYYNVLGIKVQNPAPGQIVIKRQGGTVTKMIAK